MAGSTDRAGRVESEPNMLPMIDVLLVLLIIAMLGGRYVLDVQLPEAAGAPPTAAPRQIVLELLPDSGFAINGQPVPDGDLDTTLREITGRGR